MTTEELKAIESLAWEARDLLVKARESVPSGEDHVLSTAIFAAGQAAAVASNLARERATKSLLLEPAA